MSVELAAIIWKYMGLYLAAGLVFGLIFITLIVGRLDPNAKGMKLSVRLLILPGLMLLWPWMFLKTLFWRGPPVR